MPELTDQHREFAAEVVLDHARDIEYLSVVEALGEAGIEDPDGDLARAIHNMAMNANITIDLDLPAALDAQYGVRWHGSDEVEAWPTKDSAASTAQLYGGECVVVERSVTYGPWREVTA